MKKYLVGYKDDELVFGHGDIAPILGIEPISLEEAEHAATVLPSEGQTVIYELVPIKIMPADRKKI